MEIKFIVSVVLYYVYVYLKTRSNYKENIKECLISFDLLVFLIPLLIFVSNDYSKMAIFIGLLMILSLINLHKIKKREKVNKKIQLLIIMIYLIPTIIYACTFKLKYLVLVYTVLGINIYLYDIIIFIINKWKINKERVIIKKK
jgi:hypothetical protein